MLGTSGDGGGGTVSQGTQCLAVLCVVWLGVASRPLAGQSCTDLPVGAGELWLGAGAMADGEERWENLAVEVSPGHRFSISVQRVTGGGDENVDLEAWGVRAGVPFHGGGLGLCLFGGFELNDFSFENRFEMDRGDANYLAREIGLRVGAPLVTWQDGELAAWVTPAWSHLRFEASGRTLMVGDEISVEERNLGWTRWEFSGQAGLSLRWRFVGMAAGVRRRPAVASGTLAFVRIGLAVIPTRGSR